MRREAIQREEANRVSGECIPLDGFDAFTFVGRCIYRTGSGPAVVVMHELPGLTPACIELAREIASAGFTVYLPLLFGRPSQNLQVLPAFSLCVRREFHLFARGKRSPITDWLHELCAHVHALSGQRGIGLIGMCLTGGLVFALCASPAVLAAVTCQPSLPVSVFRGEEARRDLGVDPADLQCARARVTEQNMDILGFRYSADVSCPAERFETAKRLFGERFKPTTYKSPDRSHRLSSWAHSVLPGPSPRGVAESHPSRRARQAVIEYLRKQLYGTADPQSP